MKKKKCYRLNKRKVSGIYQLKQMIYQEINYKNIQASDKLLKW